MRRVEIGQREQQFKSRSAQVVGVKPVFVPRIILKRLHKVTPKIEGGIVRQISSQVSSKAASGGGFVVRTLTSFLNYT